MLTGSSVVFMRGDNKAVVNVTSREVQCPFCRVNMIPATVGARCEPCKAEVTEAPEGS